MTVNKHLADLSFIYLIVTAYKIFWLPPTMMIVKY